MKRIKHKRLPPQKPVREIGEAKLDVLLEGRAAIYQFYRGPRVERLRAKMGLSVRNFAMWLGMSDSSVYAWRNGRTPSHLSQRALFQLENFFYPGEGKKGLF